MEKIDRATHVLKIDGDRGEVRIADEVVAIIAGMAATDVRGVASMAGNEDPVQGCESRSDRYRREG